MKRTTNIPSRLSIDSDMFSTVRKHFDNLLEGVMNKISEKGITDASVTLKVLIEMEQDEDRSEPGKPVYIPRIRFKLDGSYKEQYGLNGGIADENMELIPTIGGGWYLQTRSNGQMNIADYEEEDEE